MPLGTALALNHFPGRNLAVSFVNTGMGVPPTVVGLIGVILLWRSGPFGFTHIIYTPWAIMIAQFAIATPIITGITLAAIQQINPKLRLADSVVGSKSMAVFLAVDTRGAPPADGGDYGWIRSSHIRGGRRDHGRRKYNGTHSEY